MAEGNYSRKLRNTTWLAFLVPVAVALPMIYLLRFVAPGEHLWLVLVGGLVFVGTAIWACIPWWRTMDDMRRQGHTVSWYWGSMGGGLAMFAWLIAALGPHSDQVMGAVMLLTGQFIGFRGFWTIWKWRQRGEKS